MAEIDGDVLERFLDHDCLCPGSFRSLTERRDPTCRYVRPIEEFMVFLAARGRVPDAFLVSGNTLGEEFGAFRAWLQRHRGAAEATIRDYVREVAGLLPDLGDDAGRYDATSVRNALLRRFAEVSRPHVQRLGDIDWSRARLHVSGKSRRQVGLPLPQDAGDALLDYVEFVRPRVDEEKVFLRGPAPPRPLGGSGTITAVVGRALKRAGVDGANGRGAHLFRHSTATNLLRSGESQELITALLRHRSPDTSPPTGSSSTRRSSASAGWSLSTRASAMPLGNISRFGHARVGARIICSSSPTAGLQAPLP